MPSSDARVGGDFSGLIKETEKASKALTDLAAKATGLSALAKTFDMITGAVGGTVNVLGKVGLAAQGLEAIGKSATSMGMALLKGNANLEMTTISFKTLLGSASAADDMIKQLTTFAANTPFNLPGLETATQRLLGAGYAARDIVPLMTSLGDSISALGGSQDQLNSLIYVFSQMRNETKLNAGDLMQMSNLGIPALQMLADHYHKTTGEIQEMITKGLIPGKDAVAILSAEMETKYGGMMAAQSKTFSGMISNLQDWATATTITLTKPFFAPAEKGLQKLLEALQSPAGTAAINKLAADIQKAVDLATQAFIKFEPRIKPTFDKLLQVANAVRQQMTPGIITLIPLLEKAWTRFEPLALSIWKVYQAIQPMNIAFAVLRGLLTGGVTGAVDAFKDRFALIESYVKQGLNLALDAARKFGPALLSWVSDTAILLADKVVSWGESLIVWVGPYASKLITELIKLSGKVFNWILGEVPVLLGYLVTWGNAFADWVLPAIPKLAANLELVAKTAIGFVIGLGPRLVTAFLETGRAIGVELGRPVSDAILIFHSLEDTILKTVLPAFLNMVNFLQANVFPILDRLAVFTAQTVIPTLGSLAAFAMNVLVPAFVRAADLFGRIFGPSLVLIGSLIRDELLPWLTNLWELFDNKYLGKVQTLASRFGKELAGGISLAVQRFQDALPALEGFYKKIEPIAAKIWEVYSAISPLAIAIDVLRGFLTGGIQGGLDAFTGHMSKIGDLAGELIPKLIDGLTTALPKVFDWIGEQAPKILEQLGKWGESFGKLVDKVLPPLLKALGTVAEKVLTWIVDSAPGILDKLMEWAGQFGEFAKKTIPIVLEKLGDLLKTLMQWLGDKGPDILAGLAEWTGKFVEWLAGMAKKLYPEFVKMVGKIYDWISEKAPELADKLGDWAGAFLKWVITDFIPGWLTMAPKIEGAILKFIGSVILKIAGAVLGWVGAFLGWIPDVIGKLPGALWGIITGIGSWVLGAAGNFLKVAGDIGGKIIEGIVTAIHDAPGKIWDAVTGVLGSGAVDIIKGVVKTVANFFVDIVNTPINAMNGIISSLKGFEVFGQHPFDWLPTIPKLNYLAFAKGTQNAARGLALVGEEGMELIQDAQKRLMLVTRPMLLNLAGGEKIYNNQQTHNLFNQYPASATQIHQMYQTSNNYGGASSSNVNSNNNSSYHLNVQQLPNGFRMSEGMQRVWYSKS